MKKRAIYQLVIIFSMGCLTSLSFAADKYVRKGASGDGTSWSAAYNDINNVSWSGMSSGDTLWIAAGSYSGGLGTISTNGITVKRASSATHGTSIGWSNSYDGQVTVDTNGRFVEIAADNVTIDGVSHAPWKFRVVGMPAQGGQMYIRSGSDNTTFRNIEFDGNSEKGGEDGFRVDGGDGLTIEYCYIHDYRYMGEAHVDALQMPSGTNFTYRYNISANNGMHLFLGDVSWFGNSGWVDNIKIYNNVFYDDDIGGQSYSTIDCKNCNRSSSYYAYIENNTFAVGNRPILEYKNGSNTAQLFFRNNILYNSSAGDAHSGKFSYNCYYPSSGPSQTGKYDGNPLFTDYENRDFSLQNSSPVKNIGADLGYTQDIDGIPLPIDSGSGYAIGAYVVEVGNGVAEAPSLVPVPPANLRIVQN